MSDTSAMTEELETSVFLVSVATIIGNGLCLIPLGLLVVWRRWALAEYFGIPLPSGRSILVAFVALTGFIAVSDLITYLLGRPIVPEDVVQLYSTARFLPLLLVAVLIMAPLFEELLFRGFLFRGLAAGRLGMPGAVVITSLVWTALHIQYEPYVLGILFLGGLFLGTVRARTGSTGLTILLHMWMNVIATVETVVLY